MLYKGNKKFKTLRRGNQVITRLFKGDELIFRDVEALYGFKFTIDTTLTASGTHSATAKSMTLRSNGSDSHGPACSVIVFWGDGTSSTWNTSTTTNNLGHTYPEPGIYQITIVPNTFVGTEPLPGWLSRISSYGTAHEIISIDKKFPDNSFIVDPSQTSPTDRVYTNKVYGLFSGLSNITSIPAGFFNSISIRVPEHTTSLKSLFGTTFSQFGRNSRYSLDSHIVNWLDDIDFSEVTDFSAMFGSTFSEAYVSLDKVKRFLSTLQTPAGTNFSTMFSGMLKNDQVAGHSYDSIPADLFPQIDTSNGTNFGYMFNQTFSNVSPNSTSVTIPAGLFDFLDTSSGTNFGGMFQQTFYNFATNSTAATIPSGLFASLNTSSGTDFSRMFYDTFRSACPKSYSASIPSGLFDFLNTSNGTNFFQMFYETFHSCCTKSTAATIIPAGLFDHLDISGSTSAETLFASTFTSIVDNTSRAADIAIPANLFSVIDFSNCINFSNTFSGTFAGIHTGSSYGLIVPEDLFTIDTSNGVNFFQMFHSVFYYDTTQNWAPTSLFNLSSTANGNNFSAMFYNAFGQTRIEIPAGLFSHIDTSNGTDLSSMFYNTFLTGRSSVIPAALFSTIDTSSANTTSGMFYHTFERFGPGASPVQIPSTLFSSIDVSNVPNVSNMFAGVFYAVYCQTYPEGIFGGLDLSPINGTPKTVTGIFTSAFYYDGISSHAGTQLNWVMKDIFLGMTDFSWATAANANSVIGYLFRYNRNPGTDNTSGSASLVLQHFNFDPTTRTYAFQGRTNLTDYATINDNWK